MKKIIILLITVLSFNLYSQDFRLLVFSDYFGQIEPTTDYDNLRFRNYIRPEFGMDLLDYTGYLTVSGEFYYDYFNDNQTPDPSNILRECYLSFYPDWGDVIIGQKYTNKGKADVFSPLNSFNASYREQFSLDEPYQSKRSDLQLEANYYITDESSLELVYIPFPRTDYQSPGEITFEADDKIYTLDKDSDPYLLENGHSFFLTYNYYGYNLDFQAAYNYYTEQAYNYNIYESNDRFIGKEYNKVHSAGGAISTSLGTFGVVEEIVFNLTEDFEGNDPGIKNSDITVNTQLSNTLFGRTYSQFNIVYQYIFNHDEGDTDLDKAFNDVHLQPLGHVAFVVAHLRDSFLREKLNVALNLAYIHPNVYIGPRCNYKISDLITLETGVNFTTGEYKNKLLEENLGGDNFFVRIKYEL